MFEQSTGITTFSLKNILFIFLTTLNRQPNFGTCHHEEMCCKSL